MEEKHKNEPSLIQPLANSDLRDRNFIEYSEEMVKKLNKFRHSSGIPIGHVLRNELKPKAHLADPAANYMTHDDEAFPRCRIVKEVYEMEDADQLEIEKGVKWTRVAIECNGDVYDHLQTLWSKTRYWNHVSNTLQRERDGRGVFLAIRKNVCGPTANSDLARTNRAKADAAYYDGEKRQCNYDTFISTLRKCFKVQEGLASSEPRKCHAFTEEEKVEFLRKGCRHPHAQVGINTVMALKHLREDFEEAQVHVWQSIKQGYNMAKSPAPPMQPRNVSQTQTTGDKKGPWVRPDGNWDLDGINSGKFDKHLHKFHDKKGSYSPQEYATLHHNSPQTLPCLSQL